MRTIFGVIYSKLRVYIGPAKRGAVNPWTIYINILKEYSLSNF